MRIAAVIGPALFELGAGIGHLYQIAKTHNFALGSSGAMLYSDFFIPAIGLILLWPQSRYINSA